MSSTSAGDQRYTVIALLLHWIIALATITMLATGLWMVDAIKTPDTQALAFETYQFHKSLGITILALSVVRLLWRFLNPPPPMPAHMSAVSRALAHSAHALFYVLMIGLPLLGWAMVSASPLGLPTIIFGWFELPHISWLAASENRIELEAQAKFAHRWAGYAMVGLLVIHVGAALKHQFFDRDDLLARMIPGLRRRSNPSNAQEA